MLDDDVHTSNKTTTPAIQSPQKIMLHNTTGGGITKPLYLPLRCPEHGEYNLVWLQQERIQAQVGTYIMYKIRTCFFLLDGCKTILLITQQRQSRGIIEVNTEVIILAFWFVRLHG